MKKILSLFLVFLILISVSSGLAEGMGIQVIGQSNQSESIFSEGTELTPGKTIKVDGDYSIVFSECTTNGSELIKNGGYYLYLTSSESGAKGVRYNHPVGTHTPAELVITVTNRSKEKVNWLKRMKCTIVYDDLYTFDTLATQWNPNQVDNNGNTCDSTEAVDIEPLVSVDVGFIFAIPYIVRDSAKPLVAVVQVDNDIYTVDLRRNMEILNN